MAKEVEKWKEIVKPPAYLRYGLDQPLHSSSLKNEPSEDVRVQQFVMYFGLSTEQKLQVGNDQKDEDTRTKTQQWSSQRSQPGYKASYRDRNVSRCENVIKGTEEVPGVAHLMNTRERDMWNLLLFRYRSTMIQLITTSDPSMHPSWPVKGRVYRVRLPKSDDSISPPLASVCPANYIA